MKSIPAVTRLKQKIREAYPNIRLVETIWIDHESKIEPIKFDDESIKHYISKPIVNTVLAHGRNTDSFITYKTPKGFDNSTKRLILDRKPIGERKWLSYSKSTRESHVDHRIRMDGIANTLNTGYGCSNQSTTNYILEGDTLRFPTPRECEWLQSWPTDHTRHGTHPDGRVYEVSPSERYSMCGNGVTSKLASTLIKGFIKDSDITVGSFCSGVAGIELELDQRFRTSFFCENDYHCSSVLRYNHPSTPNFGDLRSAVENDMPPVDLVTMGWPCQDVSVSGASKGDQGERTVLVYDILRYVDRHKPRYVFGENVKNHLSKVHEGFFLEILTRLSNMGYFVDFEVIPSTIVGVPQFRERVYLKAWLG